MKKLISLALVLVMGLSMAACSGSGGGASQGGGSGGDGPVEIVFWQGMGKTAVQELDRYIEEFNASQSDYVVSTVAQANYDETYQKLQAAIAGSNAPAIALLDPDKSRFLDQKGLVEHYNPMMDADEDFDVDDYVPVFFDQGRNEDGNLYAFPAYGTTQVMYYSIEAFEQAEIDPASIKTWQDLEEAAKAMTVQENGETVFYGWEPMWGRDNLIDAALSNGGAMLSEDGKTVTINSEAWVEVWDTFRRWIHEDQIMRVHFGGQGWEYWYKTIDDVLQGHAGGYTGSSGDQADLDFSIVQAFEQPGWGDNPSAPIAAALHLVIPKTEDERVRQGAYEFIRFFTSPEKQAQWSILTGYIPVRVSSAEVEEYVAYSEDNPQILVPLNQAMHASVPEVDPTGNQIYDALKNAADKVEIDNVPAQEALDEAQQIAQAALDEYWQSQG